MRIKELRVIYSAPIFNAGGGFALPLALWTYLKGYLR
jgi:hypothetical protein